MGVETVENESDKQARKRRAREIAELLRAAPTFAQLGDDHLSEIARKAPIEQAGAGTILFRQGETGDYAYLVLEGTLSVEVETDAGQVRVAVVQPGQLVGEIAAFADAPRTASVVAQSAAELLRIKRGHIRKLLKSEPDVAMAVIGQLGLRLQNLNSTIATLTQATNALAKGTFEPRMLASLRNQADRFAQFAETFTSMALELTDKQSRKVEMETAAEIQRALLPAGVDAGANAAHFEIAASMLPAKEVGGDFYDYFMLDDRHLAFAIADVSGKGVPASLFMSVARTVLRTIAAPGKTTAEIVRQANDVLSRDNPQSMFVTLAYAVVDITTGALTASCCGHEEAYVIVGGQLQKIPRSGPALGLFEGGRFTETAYQLAPGDTVILGTDGITEAFDPVRRAYGTEAFETLLRANATQAPAALIAIVNADVKAFAAGAAQSDDLSCLVFRYLG